MTSQTPTTVNDEISKKVTAILDLLILKEISPELLREFLPEIKISTGNVADNFVLYSHQYSTDLLNYSSARLANIAHSCAFFPLDLSIALFNFVIRHDRGPQATLNYAKFIWELAIRMDSDYHLKLLMDLSTDYLSRKDTFQCGSYSSHERWQIIRACAYAITMLINAGMEDEARLTTKKYRSAFGEFWLAAHPPLASFILRNKISQSVEIKMMAELYDSLTNSENLEEMNHLLSGTRVAIVGNSPREIGRGHGYEIDAHDIVIRFSSFNILPPFDRDYGTRVDIGVANAGCLHFLASAQSKASMKYAVTLHPIELVFANHSKYIKMVYDFLQRGVKSIALPRDKWLNLMGQLKGNIPSTGLLSIAYVKSLNSGLSLNNIFGFSFQDEQHTSQWDNTRYHYDHTECFPMPHRHHALIEKEFAEKILSG